MPPRERAREERSKQRRGQAVDSSQPRPGIVGSAASRSRRRHDFFLRELVQPFAMSLTVVHYLLNTSKIGAQAKAA